MLKKEIKGRWVLAGEGRSSRSNGSEGRKNRTNEGKLVGKEGKVKENLG